MQFWPFELDPNVMAKEFRTHLQKVWRNFGWINRALGRCFRTPRWDTKFKTRLSSVLHWPRLHKNTDQNDQYLEEKLLQTLSSWLSKLSSTMTLVVTQGSNLWLPRPQFPHFGAPDRWTRPQGICGSKNTERMSLWLWMVCYFLAASRNTCLWSYDNVVLPKAQNVKRHGAKNEKTQAQRKVVSNTRNLEETAAKKHQSLGPRWYQTPGLRVFCQAFDFAAFSGKK